MSRGQLPSGSVTTGFAFSALCQLTNNKQEGANYFPSLYLSFILSLHLLSDIYEMSRFCS